MKKLSNILSSLLFSLALLGIAGSLVGVSAQTPAEKTLADYIKRHTNRTTNGLTQQRSLSGGGVTVDLQDRFQNLMLGRLDYDGDPIAGCVTSLDEANAFFGKDLESGRLFSGYQPSFELLKDEAARHGMSPEELVYYKNLIDQAAQRLALNPESATINIVNNDGAGEGFNDATTITPEGGNTATTRGAQRLAVFQAAAAIWGTFLDSNVTVQVRSQFDPLTCTSNSAVLGAAGTRTVHADFPNADLAGTWYHQALANKRAGEDLDPTREDMNATFNSTLNGDPACLGGSRFYLGLDNATPSGTTNLLVVLLHEFAHGLGFSSFANGQTGVLFNGMPDVYTTRLYDRTVSKYWNNMTDAERAASAVNTNNLLWDGANVKIGSSFMTNGREASTGRVQLYTPAAFSSGSSVSHWSTAATPNLLMEPFINLNLSLNLDLTPHQLRDVGWYRDTNLDLTPDAITSVSPSGGSVVIGTSATISWNNAGGFNKNVTIDLSTDGGATYPTRLATNIANTGSFTFTVPNTPTTQAKIRIREHDYAQPVGESTSNFTIGTTVAPGRTAFDFDGDRKTDIAIFRAGTGAWWTTRSSDGLIYAVGFGNSTDKIVPADFTGDNKTDIAVFRESTGQWLILRSEDNTFYGFPFGSAGDKAVPADFDGDGKADPTVFRPSNTGWYSLLSGGGGVITRTFGVAEDIPLPADFDGDNKADLAVFRPSTSAWWTQRSTTGAIGAVQFGQTGDKPVPADYTGDNKTDIAIFRPSNGFWYILRSEDNSFYGFPFGLSGDLPVPGDYDGDGKADPAVFRSTNTAWYLQRSTAGFTAITFGLSNDKPVPSAYLP